MEAEDNGYWVVVEQKARTTKFVEAPDEEKAKVLALKMALRDKCMDDWHGYGIIEIVDVGEF